MTQQEFHSADIKNAQTFHAAKKMAKPFIRIMMKWNISLQGLYKVLKEAYVEVAQEDYKLPGKALTNSRISLLTGVTRPDVSKIVSNQDIEDKTVNVNSFSKLFNILYGWTNDPMFCDESRQPKVLPYEGLGCSFKALIKKYGKDVSHGAVFEELEANQMIFFSDGKIQLLERSHKILMLDYHAIDMCSDFMEHVASTSAYNLDMNRQEAPRFQKGYRLADIPEELIPEIKEKIREILVDVYQNGSNQLDNIKVESRKLKSKSIGFELYYYEE